ncbi:TolC family protein [bacterium]|nr:TolC family protein [bacterium]
MSLRSELVLPASASVMQGLGNAGIDSPVDDKQFLDAQDIAIEIPPAPNSFDLEDPQYAPMSLQDTIAAGIKNSKIIRDLGGNTLSNPDGVASVFDQAITFTNPQTGEEAALSEFDARFFSQAFFEKNDRVVNNQFLATDGVLVQDLGEIRTGVAKRAINGGLFTMTTIQDYDFNNSIGNRFGNPSSTWSNLIQGDFRQPLLRGRSAMFNRIAGPNVDDGVFNGVLIAKTRTDVSAADFKTAIRNYIADVENAYWDLYFAYRDLEARKMARDNALESWRRIKALGNEKKAGGEADKEGQAREQYYRFEAEVNDALYGRVTDATRSNNGSGGGTFRPSSGVRISERRLRLLIGFPANGSELIRPSDEPSLVPISFDWSCCVSQSLTNRPEVYRQLQRIKRVKMEMFATRASLMPQLDFIGRYTVRGFGKDLIGSTDLEPSDGAVENMFDLNNQEWQLGLDLNVPIGYRRANASLRNTQNRLARERQLLREQKRQIINDLSDAFQDVDRARKSHELQYNRLDSALSQFAAVQETNLQKKAPFNLVLEAQRRVLDAQIQYYRAQVEYTLAVRNVHFEKGTLFEYTSVRFIGENLLDSGVAMASSESQILGTTTGKPLSYVISDSDMNGIVALESSEKKVAPQDASPASTRVTFADVEGLAVPTGLNSAAPIDFAPASNAPLIPLPAKNFQVSEPTLGSFSIE